MHLSEFMSWKGLKDSDVALLVGKSRPTISRIRRRKQRPDWPLINAFKKLSNGAITADDFAKAGKNGR